MSDDDAAQLPILRAQAAALARRIRQLRREPPRRLSEEELAARLGITRHEVRALQQRALLKVRRRAIELLTEENQP